MQPVLQAEAPTDSNSLLREMQEEFDRYRRERTENERMFNEKVPVRLHKASFDFVELTYISRSSFRPPTRPRTSAFSLPGRRRSSS